MAKISGEDLSFLVRWNFIKTECSPLVQKVTDPWFRARYAGYILRRDWKNLTLCMGIGNIASPGAVKRVSCFRNGVVIGIEFSLDHELKFVG